MKFNFFSTCFVEDVPNVCERADGSSSGCIFLRFVDYLEQRVPADCSGMSQVFESLVQRFLNVERYANDIRYVKHCIRCVSLTGTGHCAAAVIWPKLASYSHRGVTFSLTYRQVFTQTP